MLATERTATGRFAPGCSGNPAGRPLGSRNKSTLALEDALATHTEELVDLLLRSASEGKGAALRICFDRIAPPRKGRPVPFELPPLTCPDDVVAAASAIVAGMAAGELTPQEARDMFKVLEAFQKVLTSPARRGQAPPADALARGEPREPAETCKSPGCAAGAEHETNAEALEPAETSPLTPDPPPSVAAEASPEPAAPAETCKSPESEARADDEIAVALNPTLTSAARPEPAPAATAAAGRSPRTPAETCKSPGSADDPGSENAGNDPPSKPGATGGGALATATGSTRTADPPADRPMLARSPLFASSGDPNADRRYDRARECRRRATCRRPPSICSRRPLRRRYRGSRAHRRRAGAAAAGLGRHP